MTDHEHDQGPDPTFEDQTMRGLAHGPTAPFEKRHPRGLWVLFITEMWERFSYYGMRAILVLYLIASTDEIVRGRPNDNPGFGWTEDNAYLLYGVYTFMVYLGAMFGGKLADRLLGTHRSMLIGGWIIALGHITLACTEFFGVNLGTVVSRESNPGAIGCFLLGLALIIIGTGFFKPCVSVMVGQLYGENDPRRDSGFTIFYMGINLGAFFSPLVAGGLGESDRFGWHWGFGSAAVGMIAGLLIYQFLRPKYLEGIGDPPRNPPPGAGVNLLNAAFLIGMPLIPLALFMTGGLQPIVDGWTWLTDSPTKQAILWIVGAGALIAAILIFLSKQKPHERSPLGVIFVLAFFGNIFFWTAFEQAGSSLNVFAQQNTDRTLGGLAVGDDLAQSVQISSDLPAGSTFALTFNGETTSELVLGTTTLEQVVSAIESLSFFPADTVEIESTGADDMTVPVGPGDVLTLTYADAKTRPPFSADWNEPILTAVGPGPEGATVVTEFIRDDGFPASWYQSINPLCILLFAPVFAWLWLALDRRRLNPNTPLKFSLGLWLLGLAFIAMYFGAKEAEGPGSLAGPQWLLMMYIAVTWGELCLSPVGLSMVTKLAPERLQSFMMGVWFFTFALSNLCAGLVARISVKFKPDPETGAPPEVAFLGVEGLPGFFLMLVVFPVGMGVLIAIASPLLKSMMRGIK